jgi:hypothetical protein
MGKGSHNTRTDNENNEQIDSILSEIKIKLPADCSRPTVHQSMNYVVKDIIYAALTFIVMYQIRNIFPYRFLFFLHHFSFSDMIVNMKF